jgi:YggT family protein
VSLIAGILSVVCLVYTLSLFARLSMDWIQSFARDFRPSGVSLVAFEVVYSLTDPPLRLLRRIVPPLRLGGISLDLGVLILLVLLSILQRVLNGLAV